MSSERAAAAKAAQCALACLLPAARFAANAVTTVGQVETYATFHAAGLRLSYSGDANRNATARVEFSERRVKERGGGPCRSPA